MILFPRCVKYNEFPGRSFFPSYCAGLAVIMSRDVVQEMYQASFSTPFFWIDDVYLTGMLAPKVLDIEYVNLEKNFTQNIHVGYEQYSKGKPLTYLLVHANRLPQFLTMWNSTLAALTENELLALGEEVLKQYPYLKRRRDLIVRVSTLPVLKPTAEAKMPAKIVSKDMNLHANLGT